MIRKKFLWQDFLIIFLDWVEGTDRRVTSTITRHFTDSSQIFLFYRLQKVG